jgi:alkyl hydroperoxide reductase subunit F
MYDVIIIGGGPGGIAAGVYAARKKMKCAIIADTFSGQSVASEDIQNWIGTISVSGYDLALMLEKHLRAQTGIDIVDGERVSKIDKREDGTFLVTLMKGRTFETKTLLLTIGSRHKKLNVPGEKEGEGHGVVYCAICDAPLFGDKDVAVVGGGNSGLEAVVDLLPYAKKIYLLHRGEALKGDATTQEKIIKQKNVELILNCATKEIIVDDKKQVHGLVYVDGKTGTEKTLDVRGVFVEVGVQPNSELVAHLVKLSPYGSIMVNPRTQMSSDNGIWAAGDVTDGLYRQNNVSAGDAIKAILNIYEEIHVKESR